MNIVRFSFLGIVCVGIACGPGGGGDDAGSDASTNDSATNDSAANDSAVKDAAPSDGSASDVVTNVDGGSCTAQVQAEIDGGCTRCWPADLQMCTQGNPNAVLGMLACLGSNCWDEYDYNSAGPCMQTVISTYGDTSTSAVQTKLQGLNCEAYIVLGTTAVATEMSSADRASFATCIGQMTTCDQNALQACLDATHYNSSLCQN